jgi:caffeoyl-CoA O-methyltransferase/O-methyltransferase
MSLSKISPPTESISYEGKILPNQNFNNNLYTEDKDYMLTLFELLNSHASHTNETSFKLSEHHRVGFEEMSTPPMQLALLKFLIDITQCKNFLEIGTFIGNTAMKMAEFIGSEADVVTIEKFDEFADIANKNFSDNNLSDRIILHQGDACEIIQTLPDNYFDLIYVDGDKGRYLDLTKASEKKLSDKGIILVDDVFFHGDALNNIPTTEKGKGCKDLLEYYKNTKDFSKYLLPINNGILLLKRL